MIFSLHSSVSTILYKPLPFYYYGMFLDTAIPIRVFLGYHRRHEYFKFQDHVTLFSHRSSFNKQQIAGSNCPSNGSSLVHSPSSCQSEVNRGSCHNPRSILHTGLPHRKSVPNLYRHSSFHSMWAKTILLIPI